MCYIVRNVIRVRMVSGQKSNIRYPGENSWIYSENEMYNVYLIINIWNGNLLMLIELGNIYYNIYLQICHLQRSPTKSGSRVTPPLKHASSL